MSSLFGNAPNNKPSIQSEDQRERQRRLAGPWLHAWHDPVAGIKAFSSCVRLSDIMADGEYRLLIADSDRKLKHYKGHIYFFQFALSYFTCEEISLFFVFLFS